LHWGFGQNVNDFHCAALPEDALCAERVHVRESAFIEDLTFHHAAFREVVDDHVHKFDLSCRQSLVGEERGKGVRRLPVQPNLGANKQPEVCKTVNPGSILGVASRM